MRPTIETGQVQIPMPMPNRSERVSQLLLHSNLVDTTRLSGAEYSPAYDIQQTSFNRDKIFIVDNLQVEEPFYRGKKKRTKSSHQKRSRNYSGSVQSNQNYMMMFQKQNKVD